MAETQTLDVGKSIPEQYGSFGESGDGRPKPLHQLFSMVIGGKSGGKTSLWAGCPGALILNWDRLTLPRPQNAPDYMPKARIWTPDASGYEGFARLKDQLLNAAAKNLPRPLIIVGDSIGPHLRVVKDYIVDAAKSIGIVSRKENVPDPEHWKQLNTQAAYDVLYDTIVKDYVDLNSAGYGVVWSVHRILKLVKMASSGGEDVYQTKVQLSISEALRSRIDPYLALVMKVSRERVTETTKVPVVVGGKTVSHNDLRVERDKYVLRFRGDPNSDDISEQILTCKVPLPDQIELSINGYDDLLKEYNKALEKVK